MPGQNGQIVYPFSDQNGTKTLPDGAAHTYIAYIREYPLPRGITTITKIVNNNLILITKAE